MQTPSTPAPPNPRFQSEQTRHALVVIPWVFGFIALHIFRAASPSFAPDLMRALVNAGWIVVVSQAIRIVPMSLHSQLAIDGPRLIVLGGLPGTFSDQTFDLSQLRAIYATRQFRAKTQVDVKKATRGIAMRRPVYRLYYENGHWVAFWAKGWNQQTALNNALRDWATYNGSQLDDVTQRRLGLRS